MELKEDKYCVYQHIRPDKNEVFYVGIGGEDRPYERIGRNRYWHNIVALNSNYEIKILFEGLSWSQCCIKEKWFIKLYGRKDLGLGTLCNLTDGGEGAFGRVFSDEALKRIGKHSRERVRKRGYKQNLSEDGRKSKSNYMKNRVISKETGDKISKSHIGNKFALGHRLSQEVKNRIGEAQESFPVCQFDSDGNFLEEFRSIGRACDKYPQFNKSCIKRVCRGIHKQHKGYVWKYKKDVVE